MNVAEWLATGKAFLTEEQIGEIRKMLRDGLVRERKAALARAAALEEQTRELDALLSPAVTRTSQAPQAEEARPLFPAFPTEEAADYTSMTVPEVAVAILAKHPMGIAGGELVKLICEASGTERGNVYGQLGRMANEGRIRKRGERTSAKYYPNKEAEDAA